jgi:hypothetical protein
MPFYSQARQRGTNTKKTKNSPEAERNKKRKLRSCLPQPTKQIFRKKMFVPQRKQRGGFSEPEPKRSGEGRHLARRRVEPPEPPLKAR